MKESDDIGRILKNSTKAELLEVLNEMLHKYDKVIVVLIEDKEKGAYASSVLTLGLSTTYEAYGVLDVAKHQLQEENY